MKKNNLNEDNEENKILKADKITYKENIYSHAKLAMRTAF